MKKSPAKKRALPEFDFSKGVRGKYVERYRAARVTVQLDPDSLKSFRIRRRQTKACVRSSGFDVGNRRSNFDSVNHPSRSTH